MDTTKCLNCEEVVTGNYCSNCGQKLRPTKLPLKIFFEDAFEGIFNVDNRVFNTLKMVFLQPGQVTIDYLEGKRARYLPSTRLFMTSSVLYFIVVSMIDTTQFLFIDMTLDTEEQQRKFVDFLQYSMFVLVPVFGLIIKWIYRKPNRFFVEGLVFSMHLHVIWFFLFGAYSVIEYIALQNILPGPIEVFALVLLRVCLFFVLIYLILSIKRVFDEGWWKSILKSILAIFLYIILLAVIALSYIAYLVFINDLQLPG